MGRNGGLVEVSGQAKGGFSLPLGHTQWCCVLSRQKKCTQTTGLIETAIGSNLAPN